MDPAQERKTARLIFRVGQKVEISFEENRLCGVWFPAVVVEDLGGKFLLVEYKCAGINGGEKLRRVSVDHHHIRPSLPNFKDISFGLLDKVEAFYDFGWWSGVVTRNLADSRYLVYFKNTNKVKDLGHRELRPHAEWKEDKWLTPYEVFVSDDADNVENGFKHSEPSSVNSSTEAKAAVLLNLTDLTKDTTQGTDKETHRTTEERDAGSLNSTEPTKDTTTSTDKETCCTTEERAAVSLNSTEPIKDRKSDIEKESYCTAEVRAAVISSLTEPTTDTTSVTDKETHRGTELSAAATSSLTDLTEDTAPDTGKKTSVVTRSMKREKPAGLRSNDKNVKPSKKLKVRITSDDQSPLEAGQSKEVRNTLVSPSGDVEKANGKTIEAIKSADDQSPSDLGQSTEVSNTSVSPSASTKKAKAGVETIEATKNLSDDQSPLDAGKSKEANSIPVYPSGRLKRAKVGEAIKSISNGKKTPGKRGKAAEPKSPVIKSARKKGEISADNKGQKTLPKGAEGDSTKTTTPDIVEEQQVTQNWRVPVVMGLQCKAVTSLQSNKSKQLSTENDPLNPEAKTPQSFAPLSPKTTGNQKDMEANADTTVRRKRGRPFKVKIQAQLPETPLAVSNENGGAISAAVAASKQENTSAGVVNGDKTLNHGSGIELALRQDSVKTVKGKRGKRRSISSLETEAPAQGSQDSSVQRANGDLVENSTRQNSELHVETISDDQPLSRWFEGIQSSATVDNTGKKQLENSNSSLAVANSDGETLSFEKQSSCWRAIESMEVFRIIPQNPHFRPLNNLKQSAREEQAINKMIKFSCVAEYISRLRSTSPESDIEDHLESLSELETHGFDVKKLKNRLTDMLYLKNKHDAEKTKSKNIKVSLEEKSATKQTFEEELGAINKQMSELLAKREAALSKKMKEGSDVAWLQAKHKENEEAVHEIRRQFDELAAAPL